MTTTDGVAPALGEVIARLGSSLLTVVAAPDSSLRRPLAGVSVNDPLQDLPDGASEVLLAVGVDAAGSGAADVVRRAGERGYLAVVFRTGGPLDETVTAAARRTGVAVLAAPPDVPWIHLATMLRVGGATSYQDELAGVSLGDLFGFANSLATRVHGAVTLEDPQSHVLAYSGVTDEVDEPRKETILGRQVPRRYLRLLQERGVLRQLLTSDEVVHMDAIPEVHLSRRVAVSVRAAGELVGSIWVAETGEPLAGDCAAVLREAAQTASLHLMRHRLELREESDLRRSMVRDLLDGAGVELAAVRLALRAAAPYAVVAFEATEGTVRRDGLIQAVELYRSTFQRAGVSLAVGPRVYAVVTGDELQAEEVRRFAADGARRASDALQVRVLAAAGRIVSSVHRVSESRDDADRVMRVLLQEEAPGAPRQVATVDEVRAAAGLLEVLDLMRERPHLREGPLDQIGRRTGDRGTNLVPTLRAYLDCFGDTNAAAAGMRIHPNTFRYRLRRAVEATGVDLDDPAERLMLALQLRLLP